MKHLTIFTTMVFLSVVSLYGQLNKEHNHLRAGDVLIKQQIEYVDPGSSGGNKVWNFSKLKTINDEYTLTYSNPPLEGDSVYIMGNNRFTVKKNQIDNLIIGTEHNTMYFFQMKDNVLYHLGHENPVVELDYTEPVLETSYPLNYGDSYTKIYKSKALYSGMLDMEAEGIVAVSADAYGKIILPSGDTLSPVLRVKTSRTIIDKPNEYTISSGETPEGAAILQENYKWYSKGYRYPVFETIRQINLPDSTELFSTSFFFPPQEHLYLDSDPENMALIDEIWGEKNLDNTNKEDIKSVTIDDIITCKIYPNPVSSFMNLKYDLLLDADISFELYSIEGMPVKRIKNSFKKAGTYEDYIDCTSLHPKSYVLRITANGKFLNEIIIKE